MAKAETATGNWRQKAGQCVIAVRIDNLPTLGVVGTCAACPLSHVGAKDPLAVVPLTPRHHVDSVTPPPRSIDPRGAQTPHS